MINLSTTFVLLKKHNACRDRYRHLGRSLGGIKRYGYSKPIPLAKILETNGFDDALWALGAVPESQAAERDRIARLFACRCVRETPLGDGRTVWDLLSDERSRRAVEVAERFAIGKATEEELTAAKAAAWKARLAARAVWGAARAAAWAASREISREASWVAAWVAAKEAAMAAPGEAVWNAAGVAKASRVAAMAASRVAAGAAAKAAAKEAAMAAAGEASVAAAGEAQAEMLREMLEAGR